MAIRKPIDKHTECAAAGKPFAVESDGAERVDNVAAMPILSAMNLRELKMSRAVTVLWLAVCLAPFAMADGCSGQENAARTSAALPAAASRSGAPSAAAKPASAPQIVELVIDYGDGVQRRFDDIAYREPMTVLDCLKAAQAHSHGISFSARGSGETTMVTKIDDLSNEGAKPDSKNWIFRINGRTGDESCGIASVRPGDTVLWKFEHYE